MSDTERDANGGTFGWKYPANQSNADPEVDIFFLISLGVLTVVVVVTTMVAALLDAEWSFWHWVSMSVLGAVPALFTLLLGIGVVANRLR